MANTLTVAWATPVDTSDLGARLEAYVESKSRISVFRLCIKYATIGSPLSLLPQELVEIVAAHIRESAFEKHHQVWQEAMFCCSGDCDIYDHYSDVELDGMRDEYKAHCGPGDPDEIEDNFYSDMMNKGSGDEQHAANVESLLSKIGQEYHLTIESAYFANYRKIFALDFGLEIHYSTAREYIAEDNAYESHLPKMQILTYLILPSQYSRMKTSGGPLIASYMSSMILDPLITQEPSSERKARFRIAMQIMHLKPVVNKVQLTPTHLTSDQHNLTAAELWRTEEKEEGIDFWERPRHSEDTLSEL